MKSAARLFALIAIALLTLLPSARGQTSPSVTTVYSFTNSTDGEYPQADLIQGKDGNFYGTTRAGGNDGYGYGTVFSITPAGVYTTLHQFTGITESGTDGAEPLAGLVEGSDGNFYGTTSQGGDDGAGTVFRITPAGVYTVLRSFTGTGTDGSTPQAGLIQGSDGNFYGTTDAGGSGNYGTVFRLSLTAPSGTLQFAAASYSTTENAGSLKVTVQRTGGSGGAAAVNFSETDGTAHAGVDYEATSGTLTWADGDATDKTIYIVLNDRSV